MLTIFGRKQGKLCDGISRRDFVRIGGLGRSLTVAAQQNILVGVITEVLQTCS